MHILTVASRNHRSRYRRRCVTSTYHVVSCHRLDHLLSHHRLDALDLQIVSLWSTILELHAHVMLHKVIIRPGLDHLLLTRHLSECLTLFENFSLRGGILNEVALVK